MVWCGAVCVWVKRVLGDVNKKAGVCVCVCVGVGVWNIRSLVWTSLIVGMG